MNDSIGWIFRVAQWKHWVPISLVVLVSLALAQDEGLSCGMGPPPGLPEYEQHRQAQEHRRHTFGYMLACEDDWRFNHASNAEPLDKATRRLAFTPVSLESTPFRDFETLGGRPDFSGDAGPAALHRTFRTPQGNIVDLREWDMSVGGGQIMFIADLQTELVNGSPARLTVMQAPSGKAASFLSWIEGRRSYELTISVNVKTSSPLPTLTQLANSLPKSVPARPGEAESPFRFSLPAPVASPPTLK